MRAIEVHRRSLERFLKKRRLPDRTDEIMNVVDELSSNSNVTYYLPAVAYVILKDKYAVNGSDMAQIGWIEVTTENGHFNAFPLDPSDAVPDSVECPFCDGSDTELFSAFGSALSVSQYWCRRCRTVFEWMKWRDAESRT